MWYEGPELVAEAEAEAEAEDEGVTQGLGFVVVEAHGIVPIQIVRYKNTYRKK